MRQLISPKEPQWSEQEKVQIREQIAQLLGKQAISKCQPVSNQFISRIFLVPKPNGSYRLILNLKELNKFINTEHFKLEDGKTVKRILSKGYFMASIDLKDAYYLISIANSDRKYLRFMFEGVLYEFKCLPFGLNTAPYTFTKIMKPVISYLRELGYLSVIYLDDLLLLGETHAVCLENVRKTCSLLESLGFIINKEKSKMEPSGRCRFLGFVYDTTSMVIELPEEKKEKISEQLHKFSAITQCSIRDFARLIGTLGSCCASLKFGWVHMKDFEREKFMALERNKGDFEARMVLNDELKEDFVWWKSHIATAKCSIRSFKPVLEIFSDASLSGWGVHCQGQRAHGHWSNEEKKRHINYLELLSAFFGLKCFAEKLRSNDILLRIDNTTAIAYINKMGGIRFKRLSKLAKQIWEWCEERDLWVFASYIRSKENVEADFESRRLEPETEFALSNKFFQTIVQRFGKPNIDLFASRTNTKCTRYVSWIRDPGAIAIDAFTIDWRPFHFYAFPPFSIILRVLEKIRAEGSRGIVVVPKWPAQAWYPVYMAMLNSEPLYLKPSKYLLSSLDRKPHPLWERITLVVGTLSGKHSS